MIKKKFELLNTINVNNHGDYLVWDKDYSQLAIYCPYLNDTLLYTNKIFHYKKNNMHNALSILKDSYHICDLSICNFTHNEKKAKIILENVDNMFEIKEDIKHNSEWEMTNDRKRNMSIFSQAVALVVESIITSTATITNPIFSLMISISIDYAASFLENSSDTIKNWSLEWLEYLQTNFFDKVPAQIKGAASFIVDNWNNFQLLDIKNIDIVQDIYHFYKTIANFLANSSFNSLDNALVAAKKIKTTSEDLIKKNQLYKTTITKTTKKLQYYGQYPNLVIQPLEIFNLDRLNDIITYYLKQENYSEDIYTQNQHLYYPTPYTSNNVDKNILLLYKFNALDFKYINFAANLTHQFKITKEQNKNICENLKIKMNINISDAQFVIDIIYETVKTSSNLTLTTIIMEAIIDQLSNSIFKRDTNYISIWLSVEY